MKSKIINNTINYIDIIAFIVIVPIKLIEYGKTLTSGTPSIPSLVPSIFASLAILLSIGFLLKNKKRSRFLLICNVIITIFILGDLTYYRYFKDIISIPVIINGLMLGAVKTSVGSVFKISDLVYVIDLCFIIPIIYSHKYKQEFEIKRSVKIAISALTFVVSCSLNTYYFYKLSIEQPRLLTTLYNKVYVAKELGSLNYHMLDIFIVVQNNIQKSIPLSANKESAIKTYLKSNTSDTQNLKNSMQGKNLIVIQVEALQQFAIGSKINGVEVTPNLNKWLKSTMYFNNYYYQIASGGTSDAEFMSNNSLYPAPQGAAYYLYAGNEYNSLPKELKAKGYNTSALHGYNQTFWNRNVMYKQLGFDNFYSENNYNINETVGMGISDKSFLTQSVDKLKNLKQPYYAFMITLSSHFPYDDVKHYGDFNVGEYEGTLLGNYLKSIHYTDEQLGMFLDKLDKEGISKNSVIALYGDHYAIPKSDIGELEKFTGVSSMNDYQWMKYQKVPLMIHLPNALGAGVKSIASGQMDLYPTLANMFGLPINDLFGKDMLNSTKGTVNFRDGSFTDGNAFYVATTNSYFNVTTEKKISESKTLNEEKNNALNQLGYSDDILRHNLIKKFNNETK